MVKKNDKYMSTNEAAMYLGCSYPHIIHLCEKNNVIKAEKIGPTWMVNRESVITAKRDGLVRPRQSNTSKNLNLKTGTRIKGVKGNSIQVALIVPEESYHIAQFVLRDKKQTLENYILAKIDELKVGAISVVEKTAAASLKKRTY